MKKSLILLALSAALVLPSCITVRTGDGPSANFEDIQQGVSPQRNISFSLDYTDDYGSGAWVDEEDIILAIRKNLEKSGLFGYVHYVRPENASTYHLHFRVASGGTDQADRMGLGMLSGYTLLTIPVWTTYTLDWSVSVIHHGKEVQSFSSQQEGKDIIWLPFVLGSPFCNHATMKGKMLSGPINYFVTEIQRHKLNETLN